MLKNKIFNRYFSLLLNVKLCALVAVLMLVSNLVRAENQYSYNINAGLRSFPFGFSVGGEIKASQFLWDYRESGGNSFLFGLVQESLLVASHGLIGVNLDLYPISFLKISFGKNFVNKYYEVRTLDCSKVECKGTIDRTYYKIALALAYENFIFSPQYSKVDMVVQNHWQGFASEEDFLVGSSGQDSAISRQMLFGYKYFDSMVGLFIKSTQMEQFKNKALSQYFLWQMPLNKIFENPANNTWQIFKDESKMKLTMGAGLFSSDWATSGFSMLIGLKCGGGDESALF